jgi:hypothetical protein
MEQQQATRMTAQQLSNSEENCCTGGSIASSGFNNFHKGEQGQSMSSGMVFQWNKNGSRLAHAESLEWTIFHSL